MKMFNWILSAVLALVLAFGGVPAMAQSSSGQRTDFLPLRTRTDGQIPTPAADWVRLFWNGTGWRYKTPAGAFFDLGGGASYEFLTAADGVLTLYDDTATVGVTTFFVTPGEGQGSAPELAIASLSPAAGTGWGVRTTSGANLTLLTTSDGASYANIKLNEIYDGGQELLFNGTSNSFDFGSTAVIRWANNTGATDTKDTGLARAGAGILGVTDGSTGSGKFEFSRPVTAHDDGDSPVTVGAQRSNTVYTNEGAAASVTFELPAAVAGLTYTFIVQDVDGDLIIDAAAGDTIRDGSTVTTSGATVSITAIGDVVTLVCINGTEWVVTYSKGTVTFP